MEPRGFDIVCSLMAKGVDIANPYSVQVGADVNPDQISGDGVVIHAGCRISGASTVLSAGVELGREGPVTIEDCQLGPNVALKGGYAAKAVFLDGASLGLGHHVREGCLLEEESNGAHTVGLKQTILFPFVTLGSLINFCDVLMAGGTSRSDHSEVGSSYVHFNFTPSGDKTTASMFGNVARGVMLREKPIFLGGQGGTVGPVRVAFGTVVAAGSVVRGDVVDEDTLTIVAAPTRTMSRPHRPEAYRRLVQIVRTNLTYLAELDALEAWYRHVRAPFFAAQPLGDLVHQGALRMIEAARKERVSRLERLAGKLSTENPEQADIKAAMGTLTSGFGKVGDALVAEALTADAETVGYLDAIKALDAETVAAGTAWLQGIVDARLETAAAVVPALSAG